jgi:electron transport complex protein RnfG
MNFRQILVTGLFLYLFAIAGTAFVAFTYQETAERIAENERAALLRRLREIIPPEMHDNDLFHDTIKVRDPALLGTDDPVTVYRVRKHGRPIAVVLTAVAPDGYSGSIKLLIGILFDGTVVGVRVVAHHETPGLGDAIEVERSDWIIRLSGRSLSNPAPERWKVKRDGGVFDQFTGATITPRAVVNAVRLALVYFSRNQEQLFAEDPTTAPGASEPGESEITPGL